MRTNVCPRCDEMVPPGKRLRRHLDTCSGKEPPVKTRTKRKRRPRKPDLIWVYPLDSNSSSDTDSGETVKRKRRAREEDEEWVDPAEEEGEDSSDSDTAPREPAKRRARKDDEEQVDKQEEEEEEEDKLAEEDSEQEEEEEADKQQMFEVSRILAHKYDEKNNKFLFKCRWEGFDKDYDTWEPRESFEDEAFLERYIGRVVLDNSN